METESEAAPVVERVLTPPGFGAPWLELLPALLGLEVADLRATIVQLDL